MNSIIHIPQNETENHDFVCIETKRHIHRVDATMFELVSNGEEPAQLCSIIGRTTLNDHFLNYIYDTLAFVPCENPRSDTENIPMKGINSLGQTLYTQKSKSSLLGVVSGWLTIVRSCPDTLLPIAIAPMQAYVDIPARELAEQLTALLSFCALLDSQHYILHFGL